MPDLRRFAGQVRRALAREPASPRVIPWDPNGRRALLDVLVRDHPAEVIAALEDAGAVLWRGPTEEVPGQDETSVSGIGVVVTQSPGTEVAVVLLGAEGVQAMGGETGAASNP